MRLVEQIGRMLASIVAKKQAGLHHEARQEIETACLQSVGLSLDLVKRSSPEAIAAKLESAGGLRPSRAVLLAELLLQDAELSEAAGRATEASVSYLHAFCLLGDSVELLSVEEQLTYLPKLDRLSARLHAFRSDPYVAGKLRQYEKTLIAT